MYALHNQEPYWCAHCDVETSTTHIYTTVVINDGYRRLEYSVVGVLVLCENCQKALGVDVSKIPVGPPKE